MKPLFIANWKMNKLGAEVDTFAREFLPIVKERSNSHIGIAPPFTVLHALSVAIQDTTILLGAQNVHWEDAGAFTGEISTAMLVDAGCRFVIVGHSERRQFFGETDESVGKRATAALRAGLTTVICVGETHEQFEAKQTNSVVSRQLQAALRGISRDFSGKLVIAYEPVWAIGTGLAATPEIAEKVHGNIRKELAAILDAEVAAAIPILYGGSTKPDNIAALMEMPNINGALVGGASLNPQDFAALIHNGS